MFQKKREKQPMKKITCEFVCKKLTRSQEYCTVIHTVKFRSATKGIRQELLIRKKDLRHGG
jgi:hypothetical protein